MSDSRNFDPTDPGFYKSQFAKRLRAVANELFEWKNYGDYSPDDLVSDTLRRCVEENWLERNDIRNPRAYTVGAMRHIFYHKLPELKRFVSGKEVDLATIDFPDRSDDARERLEIESIVKALQAYFPDDKRMRLFIRLKYGEGLKRRQIAEEMGIEPREVTDFDRRRKYRLPDSLILKLFGKVM
jgi:DNA-directed RNA polymerase specialized sigma24 family protein